MNQVRVRVRDTLFAAAVTAGLGFGATQALASTRPEGPRAAARACTDELCRTRCPGFGGSYNHRTRTCACCG